MVKEVFISITLDKRRKLDNRKFPVRLRVFTPSPRQQKLYPTIFEFTEKEFQSIWETTKPRQEFKQDQLKLSALENKANEVAGGISPFNFKKFEALMFGVSGEPENIVFQYSQKIAELGSGRNYGTADNYRLSLRSIIEYMKVLKGKEPVKILFKEITPEWLEGYERYMTAGMGAPKGAAIRKRSHTTVSMYLRALRTIFNDAIEGKVITREIYPFGKRKYQVPAVTKVKKALTADQLRALFNAVPRTPEQQRAKDFWFFSFFCNGMNVKDIALLKFKNIDKDKLIFYRAKIARTAKADLRPVTVFLNDQAKAIIDRYKNQKLTPDDYVFPIISDEREAYDNHRAIKNFITSINKNLKKLVMAEGLEIDIASAWARHSFATTAVRNGATLAAVGEALSHSNPKTTQGYFAGFEDHHKKELADKLMIF